MTAAFRGWRVWTVLLAAAAMAYGVLAWRNRDVSRISRRMEHLRKTFNKEAGESPLASLRRAQEIAAAFTAAPDIRLGPYLPNLSNRQDLAVAVHHARTTLDEIHVAIRDKLIRVADDRLSATTDLAVEGVYVYGDDWGRDVTEFRLEWVKRNGDWQIRSAIPLETIKPPKKIRQAL